jgi:HD-like signal output (HDOD) protein
VLNQLLASMASEDVSFAKLGLQIEQDTVLAANVLRLVNSALYGRRGTVSSVRAAVAIMGLNKLRNFVFGLSVSNLWSRVKTPPGWDMGKFNRHALATGLLADLIAQRIPAEFAEGAFAGGLLHDIGRLMIAVALPAEHLKIESLAAESARPVEEIETEILEVTHAELSADALNRWHLPAPIQRAVRFHHRPDAAPRISGDGCLPLAAVLHTADAAAVSLGFPDAGPADPGGPSPLERIGLNGSSETILASFETEWKALGQILG